MVLAFVKSSIQAAAYLACYSSQGGISDERQTMVQAIHIYLSNSARQEQNDARSGHYRETLNGSGILSSCPTLSNAILQTWGDNNPFLNYLYNDGLLLSTARRCDDVQFTQII